MSNHTAGPWEVGVADWSENGDARYSLVGVKEICINDARLIAAAPDLLEALQKMVKMASTGMVDFNPHDEFVMSTARSAISKALGENNE